MSLRDYFAAKALPSVLAENVRARQPAARCAAEAYKLADAMLAARASSPFENRNSPIENCEDTSTHD